MTLHEKLDEELKILKEIEETRNQIRRTRSAIRKEQLARHIHKLERKYWALEKQNEIPDEPVGNSDQLEEEDE